MHSDEIQQADVIALTKVCNSHVIFQQMYDENSIINFIEYILNVFLLFWHLLTVSPAPEISGYLRYLEEPLWGRKMDKTRSPQR